MRKDEREALAARVLAMTGAGSEVIVEDVDRALTRFTHNAIHQNVAAADTSLRVRVVIDERTGVAASNDLSEASLARTVARAKEIAAIAPREPESVKLERSPRVAVPLAAYDEATAATTPDLRARIAADVFAAAERDDLWAAGYAATERDGLTIANSLGTNASFDGTACILNVKANGPDATGYAEYYGNAVGALDGARVGTTAADKARTGRDPRGVEPGSWTVILEPPAFGELLAYLVDHFSAQSYDEGSSFLSAGLGRRYAGESFSLTDDHAHRLFAGMPFDYEGAPTARVPLFEHGVANNVVTDARYARKLDRPNTGHALPAPNARGPQARHLVVASGEKSVAQLIAETKRGLLVSRFWYIRPVDQRRTIVTGMTRDGTFLIENGKIVGGVRNMRFNESILDALGDAEFADRPLRTGGYAYAMVTPAVKIANFRFTSGTEF